MDITYYKKYEPVFSEWKIVREIGEGSFGKVFELEREDFGYTYKAALKAITIPQSKSEIDRIMDDGMDEESAAAYFRGFVQELVEEFRIMSKLKGESNIVSYEDHRVIKHDGCIGWDVLIRMELLTPLTKHCKENGLDRAAVIKLGIDICKALELCRNYNIIHRDIKPENVFVSNNGQFKLGDFGIAKTVEKTTGGLSKKGTYTYMAPEVYKGEEYGASVDIYSLGIMLYRYMNNNRTPFLPDFPQVIKYSDREMAMARRIKGEEIPAPANADKALAELILKACAYNPRDRFSSPTEMREALEALTETAAVKAEPAAALPEIEETVVIGTSEETVPEIEETVVIGTSEETAAITPEAENGDKTVSIFAPEAKPEPEKKAVPEKKPVPEKKAAIREEKPAEKKKKGTWKKWVVAAAVLAVLAIVIAIISSNGKESGAVEASEDVYAWTDIVTVSAGDYHTVGLKSDGTAVAVGYNEHGQCDVTDWTDIIAVSASYGHTVGLRSDGTVVAVGDNEDGQCDVSDWADIVDVSAGDYHTVGLRADGTVVAVGANEDGQCDVSYWTDIIAVSAGCYHTVGLRSDGTVVAVGYNDDGQCDVSDWTDIVAVSASSRYTVGLRSDGTVVAVGRNNYGQCDVSDWTDIVAVSAGDYHTVGLRSDGSVVAVGDNEYGQCDVSDWTDIIAVSAGDCHTVGLRADGTVVTVGLKPHAV